MTNLGKLIILSTLFIFISFTAHAQDFARSTKKAADKPASKGKSVSRKPVVATQGANVKKQPIPGDVKTAGKPVSKTQVVNMNKGAGQAEPKTTVNSELYKSMPKAELIAEIRDEVESEDEVLGQIPELKKQEGKDGKYVYLYMVDGKQVNLEDADEEVLRALIVKVNEKSGRIRTDAMLEQQEQLRAVRSALPPQLPPRPPRLPAKPPALPRR